MNSRGFMLMEVLITLFIISLILTAMIKSTTENARTLTILKNKTAALWVAKNVFHDVELGLLLPPAGSKNSLTGITQMAGQAWYWKITFIKMPEPYAWQTDIDVKNKSFQSQSIIHWTDYFLEENSARRNA